MKNSRRGEALLTVNKAAPVPIALGALLSLATKIPSTAARTVRSATSAEQNRSDEKTSNGGPHKSKIISTESGGHVVGLEVVATYDICRSHEYRSQALEEQGDCAQCAGEKTANATAQRCKPQKERADGEEETDEDEREHESRQVVEFFGPKECWWDIGGAGEVVLRVKGIGRVHCWTRVPAIENGARIPKSPARGGRCARDALGRDFDEVELVGGVVVDCAAQEDE